MKALPAHMAKVPVLTVVRDTNRALLAGYFMVLAWPFGSGFFALPAFILSIKPLLFLLHTGFRKYKHYRRYLIAVSLLTLLAFLEGARYLSSR